VIGVQFAQNLSEMDVLELIKNRKEFVEAQIKNGFDLTTVLVGLYSDASHFIYEILQNAEDAKATKIKFELLSDKLIIIHNGIPFSPDDIEIITGISNIQNDKKKDLEKIGKFGIGFKSVYAITESPRIQSGLFDFEIIYFVLPNNFSDNNNFSDTKITLSFNNKKLTNVEIFDLIQNKFEHLEFYNLLFLSNLYSITLEWDGKIKEFKKQERQIKYNNIAFNSTIRVGKERFEYLLFRTDVRNPVFSAFRNKPKIAIAYKKSTNDNRAEIIKADSSNLFAYFETGYETFLNFLLQAPFTTTPARDNIDLRLDINRSLLDELCDLLKNALEYFRRNKLITISFLNQLPINRNIDESKIVYQKLFETFKSELISGKKYLPSMFKNHYQSATDLAIVRGRELTSIINRVEELQMLFGKKYWMDTKITDVRTPELLEYLKEELNIKEYTPDDFARKLSEIFLSSKKDEWIKRFYEFLNGKQESLYRSGRGKDEGVLRKKPIIRLTNGKHTTPFDFEGNPKVYLPMANQQLEYETLNPNVISSKASLEFIKNKLGIKEPNLFDKIKYHIVPLYKDESNYPTILEHLKHLNLILEVYKNATEVLKADIIKLFADTEVKFIQSINAKTGETSFQNYQYVYLPNKDLEKYFRFSNNIYFLYSDAYINLPNDEFIDFLKKCGVKDYVWRIEFDPKFNEEKMILLRKFGNGNDSRKTYWEKEKIRDYKLEGLEDIFIQAELTKEDSLLIWNVILTCIRYDSDKKLMFRGEYEWFYYSPQYVSFKSSLLNVLQSTSWLFSKNENESLFKPGEILLSEISSDYEQNSAEAKYLIEHLQFRTEAEQQWIGQMPAERREQLYQFDKAVKLCNEKGIDLLSALNEIMSQARREEEKKELENAPELDKVETEEEPFSGFNDSHVEVDEIGNDATTSDNPNNDAGNSGEKKAGNRLSQEMRNEIGKRGEQIVFNLLIKKWKQKAALLLESEGNAIFQDKEGQQYTITLLNTEGKKGIGCDILVKHEEIIQEYIEVKSTKLSDKDLFPVNGYQWSLAQKVFKQGEGNRYFFYVVKDVLSRRPIVTIIKNPIKKWKDGELRANPVNLEL